MILKTLLAAFALLLFSQVLLAHDPQEHKKEQKEATVSDTAAQAPDKGVGTLTDAQPASAPDIKILEEFPNYHPLIVHFPIVLLLLAMAMQFIGFFVKSESYHRVIFVLALLGYASAYFAAAWRHPHVDPSLVNEAIQKVFDDHQLYAKWAVWLGGAAALAKAVELYFKRKMILVVLTTLLLVASAVSVSISGHHGAELVHKFGVGTQGNFLKMHDDGHEH